MRIKVVLWNVSEGLAIYRPQCASVNLTMERDGERLAASRKQLPAHLDVASFLLDFFKTKLSQT
jgi:hypothetical protein